jgi:hypothetical protein
LIKDVEERLAQARGLLAREEQEPPQERTTVLNDVHRRLTNELLTAQANLTPLREREQILAALEVQYRGSVTRSDTRSLERADLERVRTVNEEAYLLYRKKAQEADIANALNQERIVNFSLAEAPSANHKPVSPKLLINFAVLVAVGLMAAVAIVAFLERNRLLSGEVRLMAATRADSFPLPDGNLARSLHQAMLVALSDQSQGNEHKLLANGDHKLLTGRDDAQSPPKRTRPFKDYEIAADEDFKSKPDSSETQRQKQSAKNDPARNDLPEAWRVKAVADYLYRVYHLSPEKLSELLRQTAGWEISPTEIASMLSSGASEQPSLDGRQRNEASSSLDSQLDKTSHLPGGG